LTRSTFDAVAAGPGGPAAGVAPVGPAVEPALAGGREQSRARYPDASGYVTRGGVRLYWERYGDGDRTVFLLPTWSIVHSRGWKLQIPFLARHFRVITFDGRGNGRSDRPRGAEAYATWEFADDAIAVMDATGTDSAALVGVSCGALWATIMADEHPERVERIAYIGPAVPLADDHPERVMNAFHEVIDTYRGWAKYNSHYWRRDYNDFVRFFARKCLNEPHSTKQIEDFIGWALETDADTLIDTVDGLRLSREEPWADRLPRVHCPTLTLHGDVDMVRPYAQGEALARATGGALVTMKGSGHLPEGRDPVRVNRLLFDFLSAGSKPPPAEFRRAPARAARRALYISSPIGLGHARRDLAIARELRRLCPDLKIDWLAQHPVTEVLAAAGERIHPASAELASESGHISSESERHQLHVFQAIRRMDEILLANFMVFHDVVKAEPYDLWIGDEAWELDYFLHENPELKTASYAWLSDFVGYLPTVSGGAHEASLVADYNAEMLEQIARFPRVRDRAIFVGEPDDIVPGDFGPGLPEIRAWTEEHFRFSGYITDAVPFTAERRDAVRAKLGYGPDERICIVTVGGSGVGESLLRRVVESLHEAKRAVPSLRMVVVAGPRIDQAAFPATDGLEVHGYLPDLPERLAVCDLAIVQGGLATTMELAAARQPFIYVPLEQHFEQNGHVRYRLERYRAGRCLEFAALTPAGLAEAIAAEITRDVDYLEVPVDGAARAAAMIAELL
jgi:pimeloyl-ACP methyl ester carboxylesterase/predicted glycosyltransferase